MERLCSTRTVFTAKAPIRMTVPVMISVKGSKPPRSDRKNVIQTTHTTGTTYR